MSGDQDGRRDGKGPSPIERRRSTPRAFEAANQADVRPLTDDLPFEAPPLSETIVNPLGVAPELMSPHTGGPFDEQSVVTAPATPLGDTPSGASRTVAPGEALQLVRFARRADTLMITGVTPHGRRLTFEQRADREGWYVVAGGAPSAPDGA